MPFSTERRNDESGIVVMAITGTMTMGNQLLQLEWSVGDLIKNQQNRIVFDMSKVTHIDSSAIGILVTCHGNVRNSGGELRFAGVTDQVLTILRMVSLDKLLPLDASVDAAVTAITNA